MLTKIKPHRTAKYHFLKFKRLKGDPEFLARGVAVGAFIGITPTIPLHTILALLGSFTFRASKIASLLATVAVSNPLTMPLQYYLSWRIGNWLLPGHLSWERIQAVRELISSGAGYLEILHDLGRLGIASLTVLVIGGCVLATPVTIALYFLSLTFFTNIRDRRQKNRQAVVED